MITNENLITQSEIKETGGGTIGLGGATYPFAKLTVNRNALKLSISLIGTVMFRPSDVVSIEPYFSIRGRGIRINHTVEGYSKTIIFSPGSDTQGLMAEIGGTGFLDNKSPIPADIENEISMLQASGSFPVKTSAAVFFIVVWNLFFLSSQLPFFMGHTKGPSFSGARLGLGFAVAFCISVLFIPPIRQLVLKQDRQLKEIRAFLYLLLAIATVMLLGFLVAPIP